MLRLNLTHDALSFLDDLPGKQYKQGVSTLFNLLKNAEPHDSSALRGYPYRRVDIGEYRIVYRVQEEELQAILIGNRNDNDVYRKLVRKERAPPAAHILAQQVHQRQIVALLFGQQRASRGAGALDAIPVGRRSPPGLFPGIAGLRVVHLIPVRLQIGTAQDGPGNWLNRNFRLGRVSGFFWTMRHQVISW